MQMKGGEFMKMTGELKKIICIATVIYLITSASYAYPAVPIYNDGIVWTYGENVKVDDILCEYGDRLYVRMNDSVYSVSKDLNDSFRYEKQFEWDESHSGGGGENIEDSRISHRDHKLYIDEIELMDVTAYEEENIKSFEEYYKEKGGGEYNPEDADIDIWAEEFVVDENTKLVNITIWTQGYIPPPYTPRYSFVFLIRDSSSTLLDIPQSASLETVIEREDGSLILDFSVRYFKSNTGNDIGVLDSEYNFTLLSESLGIYNMDLIRTFDDVLYFEFFTPEYSGGQADVSKGIYRYDFVSGESKLIAKSEFEEDEYYASRKGYYISDERNIYVIKDGRIINVLTGKQPDSGQFIAQEKTYAKLRDSFENTSSGKDKYYIIENGCRWYIKEGNLYREVNGKKKLYTGKDFIPEVEYERIFKLFKDENGNIYVLKDSGLYILEPGMDKPRQIEDLATYRLGELRYEGEELYVDNKGVVWFLTRDCVMYKYMDGNLEKVKDYEVQGYEYLENSMSNSSFGEEYDGVYVCARKRYGLNLEILVLNVVDGDFIEKRYEFDVGDYSNRYTLEKLERYDDPDSMFSYLTSYLSGWQKYNDVIFIRVDNGVIRIKDGEMNFIINDDVMGGFMMFAVKDENEVIFERDYGYISAKMPSAGDVIGSYQKTEDVYTVGGVNLPVYKIEGSDESYICAEALVLAGYGHEWDRKNRIVYITKNKENASKAPVFDDEGYVYYSDVVVKFLGKDIDSHNVGGYSLVSTDEIR